MHAMTTPKNVMKMIKESDVKYVDFRFTDPRGKWQHVTFDVSMIEEDTFAEGQMLDGSSIAGWKAIHKSDMCLMPDPSSACIDPFFAETTLVLVCDVLEPTTGEPYSRDPRGIAKKAEGMVKSMGVGDTIYFGAQGRVLRFRRREIQGRTVQHRFQDRLVEFPSNSDTAYEGGNTWPPHLDQERLLSGAATGFGAGYALGDARGYGAHGGQGREAPSRSGFRPARTGREVPPMVLMADHLQIYKYCIQQVAQVYGKTACFMPKPVYGDNGSGMHCHQSIWKNGKPVFAGNKYADLSETCLQYIAGIIKHAKAINAFTNPTTNS